MQNTKLEAFELIKKAFQPKFFREEGHKLVDLIADYLGKAPKKKVNPVFPFALPDERATYWEAKLSAPKSQDLDLSAFFSEVIEQNIHTLHPHYVGHQVASPAPLNALADFLASAINPGLGVYEMGSGIVAMERVICKNLAKIIGYDERADGFLTSGGSLGNLTALLCARKVKLGNMDQYQGPPPAVMVSEASHYCVDRAVQIMGWGSKGLIKVPINARFEMRIEALEASLERAKAEGRKVFALVANAGSTATGSYDDLEAMAAFCQKHDLWLHVDGAHGGAVIFSEKHQKLVQGLAQADSFVLDFHKLLLSSALATGLVFKEGHQSYRTFTQEASYLWADDQEAEWFNLGKRTFECTKNTLSLKVFTLWHFYGTELFEAQVNHVYALSKGFAKQIQQRPRLELLVEPVSNIVCFSYRAPELDVAALNALNAQIRQRIIEKENFYLVQTQIQGKIYLRCALMNPFTQIEDLEALLDTIEEVAQDRLQIKK